MCNCANIFGRKPVVLALVYYGCPMLCNQVEMGVVGSLKMLSFNADAITKYFCQL